MLLGLLGGRGVGVRIVAGALIEDGWSERGGI